MRYDEDERDYYKREAYFDKHPDELPGRTLEKDCTCGVNNWDLKEKSTYGEDADGNRGVPLHLYVCNNCGAERELVLN